MNKMKNGILTDHQKFKKKLITPLNQGITLTETKHSDDIIPEIFWIVILIWNLGLKETVEIITKLTKEIEKFKLDIELFNCCIISCYEKLNDEQKTKLQSSKELEKIWSMINEALIGFNYYFPNSPIKFLLKDSTISNLTFIDKLKWSLSNLFNRESIHSIYALAIVFYSQSCAGHLLISSKIERFDINEVLNYPHTEESKKVAAIIRASTKPMILNFLQNNDSLWNKNFWNISYKIEPCKLNNLTDLEP
jgi:hypothetical protein